MRIAGLELLDPRPVAGGDICQAFSGTTTTGRQVFAKILPGAPADLFEAEARGLDRLRVTGGPLVPAVRAVAADGLVLDWVEPGRPNRDAAVGFGRALATLHRAGDQTFGADGGGFVATVPLDNTTALDWPSFYVQRRLGPALREASQRDAITAADAAVVEEVMAAIDRLAGPAEPPARVHGDLWAGNLLWAADGQVWLVDAAAAHDGHRETDLAMLALFGAPMLAEILASYDEVYPRAAGWEARVALHQIHPLLAHAILFGGGYGARAGAAARAALSAEPREEGR